MTPETKQKLKKAALWTSLGVFSVELYMAMVVRRQKRRDLFNQALDAARNKHKQLIVVGDPDGYWVSRFTGRDYTCGDLCIDPKACPKCPTQAVGDVVTVLSKFKSNDAVIFVNTGVLEREANVSAAMQQLQRVSGGDLFISALEPYLPSAWLWPNKRRVLGMGTSQMQFKALPWGS